MSNEPFLGLTGPVFTAFGWAGQEQAVQYALGQLAQFVQQTHLRMARETAEKEAISKAMVYCNGNLSNTAKQLGITRPTLYHLLDKYMIKENANAEC